MPKNMEMWNAFKESYGIDGARAKEIWYDLKKMELDVIRDEGSVIELIHKAFPNETNETRLHIQFVVDIVVTWIDEENKRIMENQK